MAHRLARALTIRTSLLLALAVTLTSTVLGASALYGYQLYRSRQRAELLRAEAIADTYAALAAPLLPATGDVSDRLAGWSCPADARLVVLADAAGEPVGVRGPRALLAGCQGAFKAAGRDPGQRSWYITADPASQRGELVLAMTAIRSAAGSAPKGFLLYAGRPTGNLAAVGAQAWVFFAGLMLIAATGLVLGSWYLRMSVVEPIARLGRLTRPGRDKRPRLELPTDRGDEIGQLARVLNELNVDLEQWRREAAELRQTIDRRVNCQTAQITRQLRQAEKKIWTDPLTGLGNRRMLDDQRDAIFTTHAKGLDDLAVVLLDVDNFKTLNDTLGHQAGDELLTFIGELLHHSVRETDLAIRLGGDEFALILPGASAENARAIAERTIRLFAQRAGLLKVNPKPTLSAGVAALHAHHPADAEELIRMADDALYRAKRAGKFSVHIFRSVHHPATLT